MVNYISLFDGPHQDVVREFVRGCLDGELDDAVTHVFLGATVEQTGSALPHGLELEIVEARHSRFPPSGSALRSVTVSGHRTLEQAHAAQRALLDRPLLLSGFPGTLHVHLDSRRVAEALQAESRGEDTAADSELFEVVEPALTLEDLEIPDDIRDRIVRNLAVIRRQSILLDDWGLAEVKAFSHGIGMSLNLIGAPGTGKTMAAECIAGDLGRPLMVIRYSGLESKYVGVAEKRISRAFAEAARRGAVLFFDEADTLLSERPAHVSSSADAHMASSRSVFLMELSGFRGVVLFATNRPEVYDPAFRRRLLDHVMFPLPSEHARVRILEAHLPPRLPGRDRLELPAIAADTEGFSGSDLSTLVLKLCMGMLVHADGDEPALSADAVAVGIAEIRQGMAAINGDEETLDEPDIVDQEG